MPAGLALAALLLQASAPAACTTVAPPPAELAGWGKPRPLAAAPVAAKSTALPVGVSARATLLPTANVTYAIPPEKPGAADSHGGVLSFEVKKAGRYRVALGSAAWIDVVRGNAAATSVAHGHGPQCSGIRKMVDFDLKPGRHLLQIAGSAEPQVTVMIAPLAR